MKLINTMCRVTER